MPSLAVRAASGGIFVFLHSRSGSLSRGAGKRLRIDPVRCVGGLSAGRRKIAPHGRRRCRKSRPLPPSAVAELRGSRVAGKASCPGPLAGAGVLGTAGKKFSLYRRLERFAFEKGKREVRHRPPGPKSGGKNVFSATRQAYALKRQAVQTENALGAVDTIRSYLGERENPRSTVDVRYGRGSYGFNGGKEGAGGQVAAQAI